MSLRLRKYYVNIPVTKENSQNYKLFSTYTEIRLLKEVKTPFIIFISAFIIRRKMKSLNYSISNIVEIWFAKVEFRDTNTTLCIKILFIELFVFNFLQYNWNVFIMSVCPYVRTLTVKYLKIVGLHWNLYMLLMFPIKGSEFKKSSIET